MTQFNKKIAVLLDGPIKNDGRVKRVIESLSENNSVHLFYINGSHDDHLLFNDTVELHSLKKTGGWLKVNLYFHKQFNELEEAFLNLNQEFDFIYCNDYPLLHLCTKLKSKTKAKLIYDSHEIYIETINQFFPRSGWKQIFGVPLTKFNQWFHSKHEKKYIKKVDTAVTVCQSLQEHFLKKLGVNFLVLRNCPSLGHIPESDVAKLETKRTELGIDKDDFILLYQGDINPGRGLFIMLEVMKQLPSNFKFIILGSGMLLNTLKEKCKNESIKNVQFLGLVPYKELMAYIQIADLGISLIEPINESKRLSLPNKLFEYMSVGVPFLSNDLPEPKLLVEKYNCGVLVDYLDTQGIVDRIQGLSKDNDLLSTLGSNGREAINEELNWAVEFEKLLKALSV